MAADELIAACAGELYAAERERRPIQPLTERFPQLTVADAYRIQQYNVERRTGAGERVIGHKIGLTSRAMQEMFNVNEPDYGHLLDNMVHDRGVALDLGELIDPQIEIEPAFVLGTRLSGPGVTLADALAAIDYICACFEVIDSRIVDWRIRLPDTVADNGSSARVVFGAERIRPDGLELDNMETVLEIDGQVLETGNSGAILGHPANSLAWFANRLADFGVALQPGDVVLPGTCTRSRRIGGHGRVSGRIAGLGVIDLRLTGRPAVVREK